MSKELTPLVTPLEALKNIEKEIEDYEGFDENTCHQMDRTRFIIIENALKRIPELVRESNKLHDENRAKEKKLKALEIIKEKCIPYDIEMLKNGKVRIWVGHDRYFDVDKEEYYLLKEELL